MIETLINTCGCAVKVEVNLVQAPPTCQAKYFTAILDSIDYCHTHRARSGYKDGQVPHCGVDTSREAAQAIRPVLKKLEARVMFAAEEAGERGLTVEECAAKLSKYRGETRSVEQLIRTAGPRLTTLTDRGYLVKTKERRELTPGGNMGRGWKLPEFAS